MQPYWYVIGVFAMLSSYAFITKNKKVLLTLSISFIVGGLFSLLYIPVFQNFGRMVTLKGLAEFITPVVVERTLIAAVAIIVYEFLIGGGVGRLIGKLKKN